MERTLDFFTSGLMALEHRWSKCITLEGKKKRWISTGNKLDWLLIDSPSYLLTHPRIKPQTHKELQKRNHLGKVSRKTLVVLKPVLLVGNLTLIIRLFENGTQYVMPLGVCPSVNFSFLAYSCSLHPIQLKRYQFRL